MLKQELAVGCTLLWGSAENSEADTDTLQLDTHENEGAELKEIKQLLCTFFPVKCKELRASLFCNHLKIKGEKQLL